MKKQGFIPGSILVAVVSYLCLKGMKAIDKKMEEDKKKS
jgi:hypothetical protein